MKKLEFGFPLVKYGKDEQIDVSEAWCLDAKRNVQVTSDVGYVPLEKRVSAMIKAGIILEDMKDEFYGIHDDDDDELEELDLVQDYDSKLELIRSCKERSERLSKSLEGKEKRTSVHKKENSVENVSEDSSEENIATEDSSEVNTSKEK